MSEDRFNNRGEESNSFQNGKAILPPVLLWALHKETSHFGSGSHTSRSITPSQGMESWTLGVAFIRDPKSYRRSQLKSKPVRVSYPRNPPFLACFLHRVWVMGLTFSIAVTKPKLAPFCLHNVPKQ